MCLEAHCWKNWLWHRTRFTRSRWAQGALTILNWKKHIGVHCSCYNLLVCQPASRVKPDPIAYKTREFWRPPLSNWPITWWWFLSVLLTWTTFGPNKYFVYYLKDPKQGARLFNSAFSEFGPQRGRICSWLLKSKREEMIICGKYHICPLCRNLRFWISRVMLSDHTDNLHSAIKTVVSSPRLRPERWTISRGGSAPADHFHPSLHWQVRASVINTASYSYHYQVALKLRSQILIQW